MGSGGVPGRTVIRKELLGPDAERRARHEVAQSAEGPRYPGSVTLADAGRVSLARKAKPLAAGELAGLAAGLARVAGGHRADRPGRGPARRPVRARRDAV
jgi:hypothetical protein